MTPKGDAWPIPASSNLELPVSSSVANPKLVNYTQCLLD